MFVLNSITLIVLTPSLGMFKVILTEPDWEELRNEDLRISIWENQGIKLSGDSFYPKKCQVHYSNTIPNVFPEFLSFSKALVVNIQQPHLVFDQYNLNLSYSSVFLGSWFYERGQKCSLLRTAHLSLACGLLDSWRHNPKSRVEFRTQENDWLNLDCNKKLFNYQTQNTSSEFIPLA